MSHDKSNAIPIKRNNYNNNLLLIPLLFNKGIVSQTIYLNIIMLN